MSNVRFPVSLVIITLNEADGIGRAIASAPFCDEVVVLDSGSTDGTCDIARQLGARVFVEEWRGFQAMKQRATDLAENDWILSLDGDEAVDAALCEELTELFKGWAAGAVQADGYRMPRLTWNLGRWIRHGGWYPDLQLRLYNRKRAKWGGGSQVHERVEAENVGRLRGQLLHYPFATHAEQVATNNRYSGLGAEELVRRGQVFQWHKLFLKPISKFTETYFFKRGFLDGLPGYIIAVGAAYSVFLKYVKLWEIERRLVVRDQGEKTVSRSN